MQVARINAPRPVPSRAAVRAGGCSGRGVAVVPRAAVGAAGSQQAPATVPVIFNLKHKVSFGQEVLLVGSHEAMGTWNLDRAVPATWSSGHRWSATVELPAGSQLEFKFVVADPGSVKWEAGNNRCLTVDAAAAVLAGSWGQELVPVGLAVSYDADDEEEQASAAKVAQPEEKVAPVVVQAAAAAKSAPAPVAAHAPAEKAVVVAESKKKYEEAKQAAAAEAEEEAKQAARSGVVLGASAAPAAKAARPEIKISPQAEAAVGGLIEQAERVAADPPAQGLAKASAPVAKAAAPVEKAAVLATKSVAAPQSQAASTPKRRAMGKSKRGTAAKAKPSDKQ